MKKIFLFSIILIFLVAGEDVNKRDELGRTPLMYAARDGNLEKVKQLLKRGADVNLQDNNGRTALRYATAFGYEEIIALLKSYGAKE